MNNKLLTALSMALLFTACGSDSSSSGTSTTDNIKKKEYVIIAHNIDLARCNLTDIKNNINGAVFGDILEFPEKINKSTLVVSSEQSNVTCEKYDKRNDNVSCTIVDFNEVTEKSCVTGFDFK